MTETFAGYVRKLADRAGTAQAVADAIGMTLSSFSRQVRAGSLGAGALIRLAQWSGDDPSWVLRLAGKGDLADLIERSWGKPRALSDLDYELLSLPDGAKREMVSLARVLAPRAAAKPDKERKRA